MNRIEDALQRGWVGMGPYVCDFEKKFAQFAKTADAVSCSSGTTALHLAIAAANLMPGDEVIVPSFTWVASVNAILYQGAIPVLCDIDLDTYALCPKSVQQCITERTKAIMPIHLFGCAAPMDAIMTIARTHELTVIEDAACALGTWIEGTHAGCIGDFGTFSFHPRKVITTGEGGMVTTGTERNLDEIKALRNHGITPHGTIEHLGFNYRLSDVQGALGVGQMDLLPEFLSQRAAQASDYHTLLNHLNTLALPSVPSGTTHAFQAYVCRLTFGDATHRDQLMKVLSDQGIQTRPGTHAVHRLQWHKAQLKFEPSELSNASIAHDQTIALPIFPGMSQAEQRYVAHALIEALNGI